MRRIAFFCLLTTALALGSCGDDEDDDLIPEEPVVIDEEKTASDSLLANNSLPPHPNVMQVDMTVMVPIHPTSLKYFDYVLNYQDSEGAVYQDTIKESSGGIVVEDWGNGGLIEKTLSKSGITSNELYIRTFSYKSLPVLCTVLVEMVPKEGCASVGDFYFYCPKPYIYPSIYFSSSPDRSHRDYSNMEGPEGQWIDQMSIETFQSLYGKMFSSYCCVKNLDVGYEVNFL